MVTPNWLASKWCFAEFVQARATGKAIFPIIFTPDENFWGEATFYYLVSDIDGAVDDGKVTLWFDNVSDGPPVARGDFVEVLEDVPVTIPISVLLANDTDMDRDPLRFLEFWPDLGLNGTLDRDAEGKVTSAAIHHRPLPMVLRFSAELGDRLSGVLSGEHFVAP